MDEDARSLLERCYIFFSGFLQAGGEYTSDILNQAQELYEKSAQMLWPSAYELLGCGCLFPESNLEMPKLCSRHRRVLTMAVQRLYDEKIND